MEGKTIPDLVQAMKNGEMYTNILTRAFPDGEIRGQVAAGFWQSIPAQLKLKSLRSRFKATFL